MPYNGRLAHVFNHVIRGSGGPLRRGHNLKQLVTAGLRLYQGSREAEAKDEPRRRARAHQGAGELTLGP
ncbi:hypothetical protein BRAS3809_550014 [Bradyrhizobium sp. STM 3809]|nr:hypothetical protein BRAS3809_550014 [Bradyrhizobium sp. STM 3809]